MKLEKISIDAKRVTFFRNRAGLTQDELAEKIGVSKRTIQRIEDPNNKTRLSFKELSEICSVFRIWQNQLWNELPAKYTVYGIKLQNADEFSKAFDRCVAGGEFEIEHLPNDVEIETAMLSLSKLYDLRKGALPHEKRLSTTEKLEHTVNLRNLFRTCVNSNKIDRLNFYAFPKSYGYFAVDSGDFVWLNTLQILGISADNNAPIVREYESCEAVEAVLMADENQNVIPELDENGKPILFVGRNPVSGENNVEEILLAARGDITSPSGDIHEEVPFFDFEEDNVS
jgi:DNA-binding XRE family transcriptional regulator